MEELTLLAKDQITFNKKLKSLSLFYDNGKMEILSITMLSLPLYSKQRIMI